MGVGIPLGIEGEGNVIFDYISTTLLYIIIVLSGEVHTTINICFDNSFFGIYCHILKEINTLIFVYHKLVYYE